MTTRLPAKCLAIEIVTIDVNSLRDPSEELGPGLPFRWNVTLSVIPQLHSSVNSPRQLIYDGRDIQTGDYLAFGRPVRIYEVVSVSSSTPDTAVLVMEDLNSMSALHDQGQGGNGSPEADAGICFGAENGVPLLFPLPNPLPSDLDYAGVVEILSQFSYLQQERYVTVYQPGHNLAVNDQIALREDGIYVKTYVAGNPGQYASVGYVVDIDYPRVNYFRYRSAGPVIKFPSSDGLPGNKLYLNPDSQGGVSATVPVGRRYPQLIKLDNVRAIWIGYGQTEGSIASFVVPASSDLPTLTDAVDGDFAYANSTGNQQGPGEWGLYFKADGQWKLIATEDSATVDARTIKVLVTYDGPTVIAAHRVSSDSRVVNVAVKVTQRWDDPMAILTVGDDSVTDRFMPADQNDLSSIDEYQSMPSYKYAATAEPVIKVFLDSAGSTQGAAQVIFTYV